jgi:hypothetical protein
MNYEEETDKRQIFFSGNFHCNAQWMCETNPQQIICLKDWQYLMFFLTPSG